MQNTQFPAAAENGPSCKIIEFFGRDLAAKPDAVLHHLVQEAVSFWREAGFPYPSLTAKGAEREISLLSRIAANQLEVVLTRPSMVGLQFANSFHPQMWQAKVRGRSPVECFLDDRILSHSLYKAIKFWPDRRCWNGRAIRILMSIQNRSRVANFRPTVARALVDTFTTPGESVLDFCAGYGGRLLGAATLARAYTGIDPAVAQVDGLRKMASAFESSVDILHGCAEDIMPELPDATFDLVFSSPPYFRLEQYSQEGSQSSRRHRSYETWLSGFLEPVIEHSFRLLRKHGHLALNVADVKGFCIGKDAEAIAKKYFGLPERVYTLSMSSNPADKARRAKFLRTEPILLFKK